MRELHGIIQGLYYSWFQTFSADSNSERFQQQIDLFTRLGMRLTEDELAESLKKRLSQTSEDAASKKSILSYALEDIHSVQSNASGCSEYIYPCIPNIENLQQAENFAEMMDDGDAAGRATAIRVPLEAYVTMCQECPFLKYGRSNI